VEQLQHEHEVGLQQGARRTQREAAVLHSQGAIEIPTPVGAKTGDSGPHVANSVGPYLQVCICQANIYVRIYMYNLLRLPSDRQMLTYLRPGEGAAP
jgi:hypothetical protein